MPVSLLALLDRPPKGIPGDAVLTRDARDVAARAVFAQCRLCCLKHSRCHAMIEHYKPVLRQEIYASHDGQ